MCDAFKMCRFLCFVISPERSAYFLNYKVCFGNWNQRANAWKFIEKCILWQTHTRTHNFSIYREEKLQQKRGILIMKRRVEKNHHPPFECIEKAKLNKKTNCANAIRVSVHTECWTRSFRSETTHTYTNTSKES